MDDCSKAAPPPKPPSPTTPVAKKNWLNQWVSRVLGLVQQASLDADVGSVVLCQVMPGVGEGTFARKEWPIFFELLEKCYEGQAHEIKRIKFADLQESRVDATKLARFLDKTVDDDTVVIVASCPASKMAYVEPVIMKFKREKKALRSNVHLGYSQKEGANKFLGK